LALDLPVQLHRIETSDRIAGLEHFHALRVKITQSASLYAKKQAKFREKSNWHCACSMSIGLNRQEISTSPASTCHMIKNGRVFLEALLLAILSFTASARGDQFMMQFSVTHFVNDSGSGVPVPTDPVTGTIIYQAASISDPIQTFSSIDMTIDGHSYSAQELGFYRFGPEGWDMIGGVAGGVGTLYNQTDDFIIRWYRGSLAPFDFIYTSSRRDGEFDSAIYRDPYSFTSFTITQIPEPAISAILISGAAIFLTSRIKSKFRPGRPCFSTESYFPS
jgi:hypothetical protein